VARFLSPAWLEDVRAAQEREPKHDHRAPDVPPLILRQVVTATPDGEVQYRIVVRTDGSTLVPGPGTETEVDVTFTTDYSTASAVARGDLSTHAALSAGRIRVGGDIARLTAGSDLLRGADGLPPTVRTETTF
jgi:hypothetical protein